MALTHFTLRTSPRKKVWPLLILFFWQEIKYHVQSSKEKQGLHSSPHVTAKVNSAKYNWDSVARPRILLEDSFGERNLTVSILMGDYIWKEMQTARSESGWAWTNTGDDLAWQLGDNSSLRDRHVFLTWDLQSLQFFQQPQKRFQKPKKNSPPK